MRIVWVNPGFLHYRVPVYAELDRLAHGGLSVVFSATRTPPDVRDRLTKHLGSRAVALSGENGVSFGDANTTGFANGGLKIPYQAGLVRTIAACEPDMIVSEGFFQWTPAALWVKRKRRVPLVIAYERTAHTERNAAWWRTMYRRWMTGQVDAVACNGRLSKEYCHNVLNIEAGKIVTGAMAADSEALAAQCDALRPEQIEAKRAALGVTSRPMFLFAGQLIERKGLSELLAGWERHTSAGGEGSLVLVGEGPQRLGLEALVREKRLSRVVFAGKAGYDEIAPFYAAADVLVMPTLEDNWSLVVPEAMACGKPILCSIFNGCWPELVQSDLNGWTFDPHDAEAIAALLRRCAATDPARLSAMGQASRQIVADYTPAHAAEAVLSACELAQRNYTATGGRRLAS
jgi:glycosyltransferase involved in cell wall biosynthesis